MAKDGPPMVVEALKRTAVGGVSWPLLRELPWLARLGVFALMVLVVGGLAASGAHLFYHDQNRDEQPGLTTTDIKGVYHGVNATAPMLASLRAGHPETLDPKDRETLVKWLEGTRIAEDYDNLDLGDSAPGELIAANCVSCHSFKATASDAFPELPLDRWDDVKNVSFSKDIRPNDVKILAASTHTHALSLATLAAMVSLLMLMTTWNRAWVSLLVGVMGVALLADMAAWWVTRWYEAGAYAIIVFGAAYVVSIGIGCLLVMLELLKRSR